MSCLLAAPPVKPRTAIRQGAKGSRVSAYAALWALVLMKMVLAPGPTTSGPAVVEFAKKGNRSRL